MAEDSLDAKMEAEYIICLRICIHNYKIIQTTTLVMITLLSALSIDSRVTVLAHWGRAKIAAISQTSHFRMHFIDGKCLNFVEVKFIP